MRMMLLVVAILICSVGSAVAQEEAQKPVIVASGRAAVFVPPDCLRHNLILQVARQREQAAAEEVRKGLLALGIEGLEVEVRVSRMPWAPDAQTAQADLTVTLAGVKDDDQFGEYRARINQWLAADAPEGLGFRGSTQFVSAEAEARAVRAAMPVALKQALTNAQALAGEAGGTISGYSSISGSLASYASEEAAAVGGASGAWRRLPGDLADGGLLVVYTVTVTAVP